MNLLFVASELAPYAKTGGLADVLGALPHYLAKAGHDVRVVVPFYDTIDTKKTTFHAVTDIDIRLGAHDYHTKIFRVVPEGASESRPLHSGGKPATYFVHCPELYNRGRLYTSDADEHRRFLALQYAALILCQKMDWAPDIIHGHDWQAALLPMYVKTLFASDRRFARTRTLLTIHNLMYQGSFPVESGWDTNLRAVSHLFHQELMKAGRINCLLQGILYADGVSTVSPTYAKEIQGEALGGGMDAYLRARSSTVIGILNGVDYNEWSPDTDRFIPYKFNPRDLSGKEKNKQHLVEAMGLPYRPGIPVLGVVSRLVGQKGFKLFDPAMFEMVARHGFQLIALGSGEHALEDIFKHLQRRYPRQVSFYNGFKNELAHLIEAGADMFLMPSAYEPCGLNQMYSLRYGTVPIVHRTGGLADTVKQWSPRTGQGTGFAFENHDAAGLRWGVEAALRTYKDQAQWQRLVQNGMAEDYSWEAQGRIYERVYERLLSSKAHRA